MFFGWHYVLSAQETTEFSINYKIILNEQFIKESDQRIKKTKNPIVLDYLKKYRDELRIINNKNIDVYNLTFKQPYYSFKYVDRLGANSSNEFTMLPKEQYYGNLLTGELYGIYTFNPNQVVVGIEDLIWELKPEYQKIIGFECQKANATINRGDKEYLIEAWFTSYLPKSSIFEFTGLPGTILRLERGFITYEAFEIEFEDINYTEFKNKKLDTISFKQYEKIMMTSRYKR